MWCPCLVFIKDLYLFIGHHHSYQEQWRSWGHRERRSSRERKTQRCCRQAFQRTPSPTDASACGSLRRSSLHILFFSHRLYSLILVSLLCFFLSFIPSPESISLSLSISLHFNTSHSCLSIARTAEAIITFQPSIKHSQLWSISTLNPLHSAALNLKCLPSVSVSTYLSADKAILDSRVDDYYNRFHNAFQQRGVCVCVYCKWNTQKWSMAAAYVLYIFD